MQLPDDTTYVQTLFKLQKYIAVSGHTAQIGIPRDVEVYRFDIKMPDIELPLELRDEFYRDCFEKSAVEMKKIWPWIEDVKRAGRSNGWALVIKKDRAGVSEWNKDYRKLLESNGESDVMQIYWIMLENRLQDLDAITEFVRDEKRTHARRVAEWLAAKHPKYQNLQAPEEPEQA